MYIYFTMVKGYTGSVQNMTDILLKTPFLFLGSWTLLLATGLVYQEPGWHQILNMLRNREGARHTYITNGQHSLQIWLSL